MHAHMKTTCMYMNTIHPHHPIASQPKLRDVYEFAATTISGNAAALAMDALIPEVAAAVGEQLTAAAVTVRQAPGGAALLPEQLRSTVATGVMAVLPQLHTQVRGVGLRVMRWDVGSCVLKKRYLFWCIASLVHT